MTPDAPFSLGPLDKDEVLRYMGVPPERADPATRAAAERGEELLLAAAAPRWAWRVCGLAFEEGGVRLSSGLLLPGQDLKRHLAGCGRAALFCATLGAGVDALIRRASRGDMLQALALDACAAAAVEQLCGAVEAHLRARFPGCFFPYRYSPGYGDLPVEVQGALLTLLDAPRRVGLCAGSSHMLTPMKSVTALLGVSGVPVDRSRRSCGDCPARENCQYRKSGGHCGI